MTDKDEKRFAYCMAALSEAFSQEASEAKIDIYFKALSDLDIEDIERAAWQIINTRGTSTFPKVAELRQAIFPDIEDNATLAYDKFTKGKAATGAYDTVIFDDPIIHAVIQSMGSWEAVCMVTEDEWRFKRKEFMDLYRAFSKNPPQQIPARLIGIHEHQNSISGFNKQIPEPVLIGDKTKIQKQLAIQNNAAVENKIAGLVESVCMKGS